jgi:hypothetical protein
MGRGFGRTIERKLRFSVGLLFAGGEVDDKPELSKT